VKLAKGLLDLIILQMLNNQPMHGYEVIIKIRKSFGVYFGPSTIYPLLSSLEKKSYIASQWDISKQRPRKVYKLTSDGQAMLNFTGSSLNLLCKKIGVSATSSNTAEAKESLAVSKQNML
jgi:PadR family transcriptional regulator PadR